MRMILKLSSPDPNAGLPDPGYGIRPRSLVFSVFFHAVAVAALFWGSDLATPPRQPLLEKVIEPNKTKLVWYNFKAELPDLNSPDARKTETRGRQKSKQVLIADSKQGSKTEFVWQPTPVELPKEVKAPNLISLHASSPAPPAPRPVTPPAPDPPKQLKAFVPPPPPTKRVAQVTAPVMLPVPALRLQTAARVSLPVAPLMEPQAPAPPSLTPAMPGPDQPSIVRQFIPPPAHSIPVAGAASGNLSAPSPPSPQPVGNLNIASINLNSIAAPTSIPAGRRAGQFSSAPQTGDAGASESRGANVPGLTARGGNTTGDSAPVMAPPVPAPAPSIPEKTVAYRDVLSHAIGSSLSVPLRPGSRTVPDRIEQKFHDKPVYTMVLPSPRLPEYSADWIVWFSEREMPTEGVSQIRAPIPEKKHVPEAAPAYTWGKEADILIEAVIDETGHIQNASILKIPAGFPSQFALADLKTWQFKPATRNGVPIAVEALLDIPFRHILSGFTP